MTSQQFVQNITTHPIKHEQSVMALSACSDGESIIISGGTSGVQRDASGSKQVCSFNVQKQKFNALPDLPTTIHSHRMVYAQHKVFVIGGIKGDKAYDSNTIFVLEDNEWKSIEIDCVIGIGQCPSVCVSYNGNYVYIVEDTFHMVLDTMTYETEYVTNTPFDVWGAQMCEFNNKLYVFGGLIINSCEYNDEIYVCDLNDYEWSEVDIKLRPGRAFHGCVRYHQYALLVGGDTRDCCKNDVVVFDLENHLFIKQTLTLPQPISRMSVALVGQDVHIFGGRIGICRLRMNSNDHYVIELKDLWAEANTLTTGFCKEINEHKAVKAILRIITDYLMLYLNIQKFCMGLSSRM
eukprot:16313_1